MQFWEEKGAFYFKMAQDDAKMAASGEGFLAESKELLSCPMDKHRRVLQKEVSVVTTLVSNWKGQRSY